MSKVHFYIDPQGKIRNVLPFALILLLLSLFSCTRQPPCEYICFSPTPPPLTSINIIDRNGMSETVCSPERLEKYALVDFLEPQPYQKVLRVFERDSLGNISACITSYHPNGHPSQYLEVINSRAFGRYREWHENGALKIEASVIGGNADIAHGSERSWIFDGECRIFDENGNLHAEILYEKGALCGPSIYYHSSGNKWKIVPYKKNVVDGLLEIYLDNGNPLLSTFYTNGIRQGESVRYWSPEQIAFREYYVDGLLLKGNYFDQSGKEIGKIEEGEGFRVIFAKDRAAETQQYCSGRLEGEVKVLDKLGRAIKVYHIKNGLKHGEEIFYYPYFLLRKDPQIKLSMSWYEGKIQGIVKTWYPDGVQESQKEMNNNKKHGHSTVWYRDSSLMMIEEFQKDQLVRGEYYQKGDKFPISTVQEGRGFATIFDGDGLLLRKITYWNGKPELESD